MSRERLVKSSVSSSGMPNTCLTPSPEVLDEDVAGLALGHVPNSARATADPSAVARPSAGSGLRPLLQRGAELQLSGVTRAILVAEGALCDGAAREAPDHPERPLSPPAEERLWGAPGG